MRFTEASIDDALLFFNGKATVVQETGNFTIFGSNGPIGFTNEFNHETAIILGRVGAYCGSVEICDDKFWASDNTIVVKPKPKHSLHYWYYRLKSLSLGSYAGGAAQPLITHGILRGVKTAYHSDFQQQQCIASILSTYDDLIENNRRRMALLEDAARQVYQEWFVRLRFPGCEHTRIVDGVPEGWERVPLENALILQRGFDLPSQDRAEGTVPIYASTGINGYHNVAKVQAPGVVTGRSGSLGKVHYVHEDFWPLNTTLWVKEFRNVTPVFASFLLSSLNLEQYNGGVSVPTLDRKVVHRIEVVVPPTKIQSLFGEYVLPMFSQVRQLGLYNDKLRTARDLLLPKLMSGEIAV